MSLTTAERQVLSSRSGARTKVATAGAGERDAQSGGIVAPPTPTSKVVHSSQRPTVSSQQKSPTRRRPIPPPSSLPGGSSSTLVTATTAAQDTHSSAGGAITAQQQHRLLSTPRTSDDLQKQRVTTNHGQRTSSSVSTGLPHQEMLNFQTPTGVQRLRHQLSVLAASEGRQPAHNSSSAAFEAWRPSTTTTTVRSLVPVTTHNDGIVANVTSSASGNSAVGGKEVTIFMDALRHHAVDPPTSSARMSTDASELLESQQHQIRFEQALLQANQQTLTVQVLLRENMRATTIARHETDIVAQALDALVTDVVARHSSLMADSGARSLPASAGNKGKANRRGVITRSSSPSKRRLVGGDSGAAVNLPPWIDDRTCHSPDQDPTSVIQNHLLGEPQKIDAGEFLASQRALARVFFAGMREVTNLVRSLCSRKASLVQVLANAIESLVDNAHDASEYYASMVQDVESLHLAETVKELSNKLRAAADERLRLEDRIMRLQEENDELEQLRGDHERLQERQKTLDQFLKDQLGRNAAIMKMATQATGGVIPAHVVAAMSGNYPAGAGGGGGGGFGRRRSSRGKSLMRRSSTLEGNPVNDHHHHHHDDSSDTTPNKNAALVANAESSGAFEAPPFFLQGAANGDDDAPFTVSVPDDMRTDDINSDDFDTADAAVQTGIEDAVNCQLVGEMNAYFSEMDKAANFSQALCRVVYGTTDFYNPGDCCDNARKLLEEITLKAQDLKEAAATAASGGEGGEKATTTGNRSLMSGSGGGGGGRVTTNFATLIGYMDLPKERIVKLLQYGSNAAREMRLRFASMSENESFRRAVEWRPPRGPREPCRLCARLGPIPEDLAAVAESNDLRTRVAALEGELGEARSDVEKLHKRVDHERQVAQTHYDEVQAIHKIKFSMQHRGSQSEATVKYSSGAQTDAVFQQQLGSSHHIQHRTSFSGGSSSHQQQQPEWLTNNNGTGDAGTDGGPWVAASAPTPLRRSPYADTENSSLSNTPTTGGGGAAGHMERSPFQSADAEWSQFRAPQQPNTANGFARMGSAGTDNTFLTRSANVSARRRSSIEVTFDRDAVLSHEAGGAAATTSARNSPGNSGGGVPIGRQQRRTSNASGLSPYSEAAAAAAGSSQHQPNSPPTSANRRGSEMTVAALKYRDAFLSLSRAGSGNSSSRQQQHNASFYGGISGGGSRSSFAVHLLPQAQAHGIPSFYQNRVSPVDVDALTLGNGPVKSHTWAVKLLAALYRTRYSGHTPQAQQSATTTSTSPFNGSSSDHQQRTSTPDKGYTCSRHFTDFLRQNFGTRQLIDDNAANFLRCVHTYAPTDPRFMLFAKLFSDEYHREVYRHFLKFNAFLDQTQNMFESGGSSGAHKRANGDDQADPGSVPLESVLHCIHTLFYFSERIHSREEFCNLLAEKAVELSSAPRVITSADNGGNHHLSRKEANVSGNRMRRASLAVKSFESTPPGRSIGESMKSPTTSSIKVPTPPPGTTNASLTPPSALVSALGTPIESSDSFSKYRVAFTQVTIPRDGMNRVVQRIAFLAYLCDIARPYVLQSVSEPSLSPLSSRPTSAPNSNSLM